MAEKRQMNTAFVSNKRKLSGNGVDVSGMSSADGSSIVGDGDGRGSDEGFSTGQGRLNTLGVLVHFPTHERGIYQIGRVVNTVPDLRIVTAAGESILVNKSMNVYMFNTIPESTDVLLIGRGGKKREHTILRKKFDAGETTVVVESMMDLSTNASLIFLEQKTVDRLLASNMITDPWEEAAKGAEFGSQGK